MTGEDGGRFVRRDRCELCRSDRKETLVSSSFSDRPVSSFLSEYYEGRLAPRDLARGTYEIVRCLECGFMWQTDILTDASMSELYEVWISPEQSLQKKTKADLTDYALYARQAEMIGRLLGRLQSEIEVLDFGMGWGHWCAMVRSFGYNVAGMELSQPKIEHALANGIEVIDQGGFESRTFDFINAEQVFEHIPHPSETLKDLAGRLAPGGFIRIAVPDASGADGRWERRGWRPAKDAFHPLEHINCFTHGSLVRLGRLAGLEPVREPSPYTGETVLSVLRSIASRYYHRRGGTELYFKNVR